MTHALTDPPRIRSWRLLLLLILAMTVWRLAIAALMPVTQDEAYYFDWARSLAWGYFDHPPGVAFLGLGTLLEPGSAFMARLGGLIAGTLTLLVLARFYRNCGLTDNRDLTLALILAFATLPGLAGGVLTTPDTALALGWALALHEGERALAGERRRWLTAGVAIGLGLLGKYTMVLIGPIFLWAILRADWRALRTPWPYLGALMALLVFAPNLLWNANQDWLTMRFQFGHGFSTEMGPLASAPAGAIDHAGPESPGARLASLFGYLGTQLAFWGLIGLPLLLAPWLARWGKSARLDGDPPSSPSERLAQSPAFLPHARVLLSAATVFPLGFFALVATMSDVEANWPIMYLLTAAPLAAVWLRRVRRWVFAAAAVNLLLVSLYAVHAATGALPLPDSQNRILRETHGFTELARIGAELDAPVYADRYQTAAMLRFHQPDLDTSQWPGLTRPSEYLRGQIAPRVDPETVAGPFWLVTRFGAPPAIAGFSVETQRTLFDCPAAPLRETPVTPCRHPLHVWHLYCYTPVR
ncbi:glycosyltransferase family 39 protein [Thiocystis violascens]|uniref:PMT family glycosyltransferase, 4-amino-4-deoxy-L-arabinose transferase n=1 Tax=Thiocystis violascens (strain ATCC 17096 / DSM 198 / 6111) TaxID=765911 RepID=I3Y9Q1_THIV6|nr:glycosyltransferase family 39 protein [Thiocystis violascens]AFL73719.1 PMT family glycosyltransferase, 4-amino-4-deoxy-L-arabinose transferase [Thiocystis violascens DSM 198]